MRPRILSAVLSLGLASTSAVAGDPSHKEAGVVVDAIGFGPISANTPSNASHPSNLACIGFLGQRREGVKVGMEFLGCGGDRPGVGGFYGGGRMHWGGLLGPIRLGGGAGLGLGGLNDRSDLTGNRWSTFLYVKPGITAGLQLGGVGIDLELFSFLPVHLVQVISADATSYRTSTPGIGARVGVMFGKSPKRIREEQEAVERARRAREEAVKAAAAREQAEREAEARRAAERREAERREAERWRRDPYDDSRYRDPRAGRSDGDRPLAIPAPSSEPPPREGSGERDRREEAPLAIPAGPF